MTPRSLLLLGTIALALAPFTSSPIAAQAPAPLPSPDQSAAELHRLVAGLTVTSRVLVIGMHPDDEDTELITWLARGHHIETAYLSITRGEAGLNYGGDESGSTLGAIRTQEVLAARRIDGAKQFFTRAFDFGAARNTADVLEHWHRDSIVGDMVAVIRAFRPHVIVAVFRDSVADGNGQHQALGLLADHAFLSSADPRRFPATPFGAPWPVSKLYRHGAGLQIDIDGYDRVLGRTYVSVATESRAQHRSQGLADVTLVGIGSVMLRRVGSRVGDSAVVDQSLFGGIDTSFARLAANAPPDIGAQILQIAVNADSARDELDVAMPTAALPYLARVAQLATSVRAASTWCRHPSGSAAPAVRTSTSCDHKSLELDASIDLVRERAVAALLAAAGVSFETSADRELVATSDTANVSVTIFNRGTQPVTLSDVAVWGSASPPIAPIIVPPDSAVHFLHRVSGLADPRPWWIGARGGEKRGGERFGAVISGVDGLSRSEMVPEPHDILGVAVPENIRRTSDVTVALTVAGAAVSTSLGPVIYRYADAQVGLQNRPLAGIPDLTIQFARGLEWIPRNTPVSRAMRVAVKSHSDRALDFRLRVVAPNGMPKGLRVDSLPSLLQLGPHEQRELVLQLRGRLEATDRNPLGIIGAPSAGPDEQKAFLTFRTYQTGLRTIQRDYLPPIRLFPSSGEWIQPVDIAVPPTLTALYVPGVTDDVVSALKQVGVWVTDVTSPEQLLTIDLSRVTTVAIGPRAFQLRPELLGQVGRLLDFVRRGGALVVLRGDTATTSSRLFPYPIELARPVAERIVQSDAPVSVLDQRARVLNWPNKIGPADWSGWVGERAQSVPSVVDPRYVKLVEIHDPDEPDNRNSILVARVGKGVLVYTTLTLEQQIAGGVPGGLRLLVNLLSAGIAAGR